MMPETMVSPGRAAAMIASVVDGRGDP